MGALRSFCLILPVFCRFGEPITVPDSSQGEAWFAGYVDTVPPGGAYDYLLGWSFEVRIDYRLSGWDRVTPFTIRWDFGDSTCHWGPGYPPDANTNCFTDWSGPVDPDIMSISIADGELTGMLVLNGAQEVSWGGGNTWGGYDWNEDHSDIGDISGPVTGVGMFATPEPSVAATMALGLGALLCAWMRRNRRKHRPAGVPRILVS